MLFDVSQTMLDCPGRDELAKPHYPLCQIGFDVGKATESVFTALRGIILTSFEWMTSTVCQ